MPSSPAQTLRHVRVLLEASIGGESPREDAALLLTHRLGVAHEHLLAYSERQVAQADRQWLIEAAKRRAAGCPLAYILGEAWFYGRRFMVDEAVLVPRPESEHLIEAALIHQPGALRCLDVGTGSGCLAVTLACELPDAQITAVELSPAALKVARANALCHGVSGGIHFIEGFLLNEHTHHHDSLGQALNFGPPYDLVLANLPYIPTEFVPQRPNPVGFEPRLALDGGLDGLQLYHQLVLQLPPYLAPQACIVFEAAPDTISGLTELLRAVLPPGNLHIGADYAGLQRFVLWKATPLHS